MDLETAILAAVIGYLSGSISYAILVTRLVAPGSQLDKIRISIPDSDIQIESASISATTVRAQLGPRYGCLVSILDIAKATVPALIFKLLYPDTSYYLIAAGMTVVGHNWPVFHRFHGGRGLSSILGGMIVVDWIGLLVTNLISSVFGVGLKNRFVMTRGGVLLMIPWLWFVRQDTAAVIYTIAVNAIFWIALIPDTKQMRALKKSGQLKQFQHATQYKAVGIDGTERVDDITIATMRQKIAAWWREKRGNKA